MNDTTPTPTSIKLASDYVMAWAAIHGASPNLESIQPLAALVDSLPATPPQGVNVFAVSDGLYLVKNESPAHDRLRGLGLPDVGKFGYRPYCNLFDMGAPAQAVHFFHQPKAGWTVIQLVVLAKPDKRTEVCGEFFTYIKG